VAIVEAGGFYETDNGNISQVPGYASQGIGPDPKMAFPLVDWGFVTQPQAVSDFSTSLAYRVSNWTVDLYFTLRARRLGDREWALCFENQLLIIQIGEKCPPISEVRVLPGLF